MSGVRYLDSGPYTPGQGHHATGHDTFVADEGVLADPGTEIKRTSREARLAAEPVCPELRTRGVGCAPDNVDTSVRVRFTQPRKARP